MSFGNGRCSHQGAWRKGSVPGCLWTSQTYPDPADGAIAYPLLPRISMPGPSRLLLDQISRSGESEGERARQMQALQATFATRLKTCEDEATASAKERSAEREKLSSDFQRKETQLVTERDDQKKLAETQTAELERCRAENGPEARPAAEKGGSTRAPAPTAGSAAPAASIPAPAASTAAPTPPVTTAASPGAPAVE